MDDRMLGLLRECKEGMGVSKNVHVVESDEFESPALFGCVKTRLLLPRGLRSSFSHAELRHVFRHELAHVKRGDIWWNYALTFLQIAYWFNPSLWFVFGRIRADRELACDALALQHTPPTELQSYGETIIRLLEAFQTRIPLPGLVGMSEDQRQIKRRIRMIGSFGKQRTSLWLPVCLLVVVSFLGLSDAKDGGGNLAALPPKAELSDTSTAPRSNPLLGNLPRPAVVAQTGQGDHGDDQANPTGASASAKRPGKEAVPVTRTYRLDPNTFTLALGVRGTNDGSKPSDPLSRKAELQKAVQKFFDRLGLRIAGIDNPPPFGTSPEKSFFYNDRNGILYVRASPPELEMLETGLKSVNTQPPQITVVAKIIEIDPDDQKALGFDRFFGTVDAPQPKNPNLRDATAPEVEKNPGVFPGGSASSDPRSDLTGILTDPQFRMVVRALEQKGGFDLLATPKVTTLSGRQARISSLDGPTREEAMQNIPATGPTLEIIPTVSADGYTIQLNVDFSLVEKIQEEKPGVSGKAEKLPRIQRRQLSTTATVWDGQTVVLGGMATKEGKKGKNLIVFITPTIIDPAGNRVHVSGYLPFNPDTVPKQAQRPSN